MIKFKGIDFVLTLVVRYLFQITRIIFALTLENISKKKKKLNTFLLQNK